MERFHRAQMKLSSWWKSTVCTTACQLRWILFQNSDSHSHFVYPYFNRNIVSKGELKKLPVKEIPATSGLWQSLSPTAGALSREQVTTFMTPGGIPASFASAARRSADNGVSSAGFITQVHPAAKAAATLRAIIAVGKFH